MEECGGVWDQEESFYSTLEDKEASFDGTLIQMCLKGQLMVTHTLMSHGGK